MFMSSSFLALHEFQFELQLDFSVSPGLASLLGVFLSLAFLLDVSGQRLFGLAVIALGLTR